MACDSQIIRSRNLPAVAYVSEKREFNFSCMEKKRFSGQSADLRDDWNGYVSDDVLPCHSGVKSGNCDSYSVFCTHLNYGVLCISGKKISKERRSACSGSCNRRYLFACNTWKYKKLSDHQCSIILGIVIRFCFCSL